MIIREAEPADAPAIEALYRTFVRNSAIRVLRTRVAAIRADTMNFLLVADDTGRIVGTAHLTMCMDAMFADAPYAVLENVVVTPDARHGGIGRALLARVDEIARANECTKIMLLSSTERADAHRFFVREGFDDDRKRGFVKYLGYPQHDRP